MIGGKIVEILGHPSVVLGELDAATAAQVDQLLLAADVFDACVGHIVHIARSRGRPVLTDDPGRLRRIDPGNPTGPALRSNQSDPGRLLKRFSRRLNDQHCDHQTVLPGLPVVKHRKNNEG